MCLLTLAKIESIIDREVEVIFALFIEGEVREEGLVNRLVLITVGFAVVLCVIAVVVGVSYGKCGWLMATGC